MKRAPLSVRLGLSVLVPMVAFGGCTRRLPTQPSSPVEAGSALSDATLVSDPAPGAPAGSRLVPIRAVADEPAPAPIPGHPPPPPPAAPDATPADLLEAGRRAAQIDADARQVAAKEALASARAALAAGDLDGARAFYGKALQLDGTNTEAQEGWRNLNADRPSSVGEYFDRTRREEAVRRDQAVAQVSSYLKRGQTLEAQEDFKGAIKEYQAAHALVSWYSNQASFPATSDSIRDLIDRVRAKAERKSRDDRAALIRTAQGARELDLAREREERLGRIRAYFREADLAYRRGEYSAAREYAKQVLLEDPQNCGAQRLIDVSYEKEHLARTNEANRKFDEEWKTTFEQLKEATIPQSETVVFPEDWLQTVARRKPRQVGDIDVPTDNESKAAIIATLEAKRVKGLQFQEQNLDQVVTYLRTVTGLNFHITQKVRQDKFDSIKITIPLLDDVSVKDVLDLVTVQYELRWEPREGVVTIALKDEVSGQLRQRYYDVKDLAVKIQNFRGTDIFLAPSNFTPPEPPELAEPASIFPQDALVDTIKAVVDPETWIEGTDLQIKNGTLIAKNTSEVLDKIDLLLNELRKSSGPMVSLEVRFISVEDNFLRDVGVDIRGLGNEPGIGIPSLGSGVPRQDDVFFGSNANPSGVPFGVIPEPHSVGTTNDTGLFYNDGADGQYHARVENLFDTVLGNAGTLLGTGGMTLQHTFLDDTQMEVILRAVQKSERIETLTAANVTVYNTQRAVVEVLNKVAYVADYDVEIAQASNIANPIIRNAIDGVVLDVKPVVSSDRRFITLELRPTVATLVRPIPTFSTSLASGPVTASAPVVIQVPKLTKSSVRTTVTMPDGGTLLIGGLKFYEEINATSEIPVLGKLPVLGFLFSRKGSFINRRNLIVLITARVEALEEREPQGEWKAPVLIETFVPLEDPCVEDFAPTCAPPPCAPPPCPPPPCDPCGRR